MPPVAVALQVVAICGGARMKEGNTSKLLTHFLGGMQEGGASVELFYSRQLDSQPCLGEFACWTTNPGVCHINDKMQLLYPRLRDADVLVLATPVYIPLPGEMQNLLNRLLPLIDPRIRWLKGRTRPVGFRAGVKIRKIVLVSTSGWWERANFGTVMRIVREFARGAGVDFAGGLLRPNFNVMVEDRKKAQEIYNAAKQAGYQLAIDGKMSKHTLATVSQPLIPSKEWRRRIAQEDF